MKRQQLVGAVDCRVGVLLEGQGDVEAQAVVDTGPFMGSRHDPAAGTGDHHQVRAGQGRAQLSRQGINGMFDRRSCRAEDRDFAASFVAFQSAEGMIQLTQGLEGDLCVPAVAVVMRHAQDGEHHVSVERQVRAVGGDQIQLLVNVIEVDSLILEVAGEQLVRLVRHSNVSFVQQNLRPGQDRDLARHCLSRWLRGPEQGALALQWTLEGLVAVMMSIHFLAFW